MAGQNNRAFSAHSLALSENTLVACFRSNEEDLKVPTSQSLAGRPRSFVRQERNSVAAPNLILQPHKASDKFCVGIDDQVIRVDAVFCFAKLIKKAVDLKQPAKPGQYFQVCVGISSQYKKEQVR